MKLKTIFLALAICFASMSTVDAQLFRSSGSNYGQNSQGYFYKGKQYVRGVDLPSNPNCPCPMCVDLVSAYMVTHPSYRPQSLRHLWPAPKAISQQPQVNYQYQATMPAIGSEQSAATKLIGTPQEVVKDIVDIFQIKEGEDFVLLDPGCGDARILIEAAKRGARGVGIEINPETYEIALENIKKNGFEDKIKLYLGDSRKYKFNHADGVVMFLFDDLIEELSPKFIKDLKVGARVVSYSHDIPLEGTVKFENFYVWTKEE